jgi:hypothetical protein
MIIEVLYGSSIALGLKSLFKDAPRIENVDVRFLVRPKHRGPVKRC